jgi:eukaryotic-like serine/threonine-protein kinase
MFHRLGRLLALFYLNDEAQAVQRLIEARGIDEHRASREVLGISYDQLGLGVARQWNFPDTILATLPAVRETTVTTAQYASNRQQVLAELACALTDATSESDDTVRSKRMAAVAARFARATGSDAKAFSQVADEARKLFSRDAPGLGLGASRLAVPLPPPTQPEPPGTDETIATLVEDSRLGATIVTATATGGEPKRPENRRAMLAAGVQDITQALAGDFVLNDVLRIILETAYRAMGFRRTLLFIRDAKSSSLRCRLGFGPGAAELAAEGFAIPLTGSRDIFAAALSEAADLCIADIEAERIREHVPDWFRSRVTTRGLVLFPIHVKKRPVALIYADADDPALLTFDDEELSLLKTLRNQAILAVRASG